MVSETDTNQKKTFHIHKIQHSLNNKWEKKQKLMSNSKSECPSGKQRTSHLEYSFLYADGKFNDFKLEPSP
jgi:hypothetical protein